jgi:NADH-quinone oxidoreductase subunit E
MSPDEVDSVATFYNRIYRKPVGKTVVTICDSVSCWIMGYRELQEKLCAHLVTPLGGTTSDGEITLLPTPCLGACDRAPVAMIGEKLDGPLSIEQLIELVDKARGQN